MVIDLVAEPSHPIAAVTKRTPVQAVVDGAGYDGGLLLYVDEGRLSGLECWWVTEDAPTEFPPVEAIGQAIIG